jgi:hypothetical protein
MKIHEYNQMKAYLTRPSSPDKVKAVEEKQKKELEERRLNTRKRYGLDTVVYDNSNVVVANNELITENQLKQKIKSDENKKSLPPIIKPESIYEKMVEYGDVEADDMMVKYDSTTGLFSNKARDIAFKNVAEARKWNGTFEKYSPTVKKNNEAVRPASNINEYYKNKTKPEVKPAVTHKVKPFVKPTTSTPISINIDPLPDLSPRVPTAREIEQEQNFYKMLEQQEREKIIRQTSGLNALAPRIFGNNKKARKYE